MSPVEWGELPSPSDGRPSGGGKWRSLLAELMDRPGDWAAISDHASRGAASQTAFGLRHGRGTFPEGTTELDFEFAGRAADGGTGKVWARYIGETDDAPSTNPTPIRREVGSRSAGYPCEHCEAELDTPGGLKHHVRRNHPDAAA